jgi:P4 family phage/plasmid primase-like protien
MPTAKPTKEILPQAPDPQVLADTFAVSFFNDKHDTTPQPQVLTWPQLCDLLTTHATRKAKDGRLFSPTRFDGKRRNADACEISLLCLDFDNGTTLDAVRGLCEGLDAVIYTTHSHSAQIGKYRAVIRLARPVAAADWPEFWKRAASYFGSDSSDRACKDLARFYYLPACPEATAELAHAEVLQGVPLEPDNLPEVEAPALPQKPALQVLAASNGHNKNGAAYVLKALHNSRAKMEAAADGEKHRLRITMARTLGGYAHTGHISDSDIMDALAVNFGADEANARKAIADGIEYGKAAPLDVPPPKSRIEFRGLPVLAEAESRAPGEAFAVDAREIPAPQLTNENGQREYAPRQIVALLYPKWSAENIASHAAHALRVRDVLGESLRYCPELGWLGNGGTHWKTDDKHATATAGRAASLGATVSKESALLFEMAAALARDARSMDADAMSRAAVALLKHAKQCETRNFIDGALHLAAGDETTLRVTHDAFDQKPWVIGFQNGTWARGQWRDHRRDDYLLHLSPVAVDPKTDRSEWLQVLARITGGDDDFARTLQDIAGYVLSGASHLRFLPWAYGPKGTGKSTFTELLQTVLGTMAATIDPKLLAKDAARERLGAVLWNRRLAVCAEAGNQRIDAELLKTLSGSDTLSVRFLFRESFDTKPRHVLMMVANDAPRMDAYDDALRDRVVALPFVHRLDTPAPFELTGGARIEAVRQDPNSPLARGFAAWAMEGLARVHRTESIHRATCIEAATAKFWADTDPLTGFWEAIDQSKLAAGISKSELRKQYESWCEAEGTRPIAARQWTRACKDGRGLSDEQRAGGKRFWFLPIVAEVAKQTSFSDSSREKENSLAKQIENSPCFATSATQSDDESEEF